MIKDRRPNNKITTKKEKKNQGCSSDQHPWFSFRYLTANAAHTLKFLDGLEANERVCTLTSLFTRLDELSHQPWTYWINMPKLTGLETLPLDELRFSPGEGANLTRDTTIYVFRFDTYQGSRKGRIMGFKSSPCSVYHIIGFDFDFSAYSHGA